MESDEYADKITLSKEAHDRIKKAIKDIKD